MVIGPLLKDLMKLKSVMISIDGDATDEVGVPLCGELAMIFGL